MNDQGRSVEEEPNSDEEATIAYEPPAIVVLGTVDQLTAQEDEVSGNGQSN